MTTISSLGTATSDLPVRDIPGSLGRPILGPLHDRLNYFWFQGRDRFFHELMEKHESTVLRVNMPPGPPFFPDGRTIVLLDAKSFPVLFNTDLVTKRDVFVGTYMPSLDFTGGHRVLPYLDPSEPKHAPLKRFCFNILKSAGPVWIPGFHTAFEEGSKEWDAEITKSGKASVAGPLGDFTLNHLCRSVLEQDPHTPGPASLGKNGPTLIQAWLALQLAPQASTGLPKLIDELALHTFPLPHLLVALPHHKIVNFFRQYGGKVLDSAEQEFGLDRDEALHNLMFFICFNTWGGLQILLPSILDSISNSPMDLQIDIANEVRATVAQHGGVSMQAIESMELVKSVAYEVLRIQPPVPYQYGRAKKDFIIESHDYAYHVAKGELLGGYQGIAMKDPKVFDDPLTFQPRRFMGEDGKQLLQYLYWSNGRTVDDPTVGNKQCAGKDFVHFLARLFIVEMFLKYDFFQVSEDTSSILPALSFTQLKKKVEEPTTKLAIASFQFM